MHGTHIKIIKDVIVFYIIFYEDLVLLYEILLSVLRRINCIVYVVAGVRRG